MGEGKMGNDGRERRGEGKGDGKGRQEGRGEKEGRERSERSVGRRECVLLVSSVSGLFVSSLKLRPLPSPPVHSSQREGVQLEGTRLFE